MFSTLLVTSDEIMA